MNEKQKQRAIAALDMWHSSDDASLREYRAAELMAGLLQELADAPEVLTATNPAQISSLEPAPSVPDGWRPFLTDVITAAGLLEHGKRDKGLAGRIGKFAFAAMRATPTPPGG